MFEVVKELPNQETDERKSFAESVDVSVSSFTPEETCQRKKENNRSPNISFNSVSIDNPSSFDATPINILSRKTSKNNVISSTRAVPAFIARPNPTKMKPNQPFVTQKTDVTTPRVQPRTQTVSPRREVNVQ